MKYTRKNESETKIKLELTLDASDLSSVKQKTVAKLAKRIKIAGFREGKVPASVAERHLDPNALSAEIAEDAINLFVSDILQQEKLQPIDRPNVDLTKYVVNDTLECTVVFETIPAINLGDFKNLKASKEEIKVEDKEIDDVVERMRLGLSEKKEVERAAQTNDEVWIDFDGKDKKGGAVAGATGKDYPLVLGSDSFIPGFEAGLIGKKTGETIELPLTFPENYHHKPLANAKVTFTVTIKKINEIVPPEVNDEFAAKCGPFKTVEELKADIRRELTDQKERAAVDKLKDSLVEQLVKGSDVKAPEVLVEDQITSLERDFAQNLMYRGLTLDQYLDENKLTQKEWRDKELREQAVRRVEVGLCLAELSKVEAIEVSKEELNQRLNELLQQYGNDKQIRTQLDTPDTRRDIANRLITEKTIERLVELNQN